MAEFQYYSGEETAQGPKSTQTGAPAPPPNALQFFDDQTAGSQAWSNAIDTVFEVGTVAVDIATKLKEAEHQNQADAFFLDYTQKVQGLRDNINSGKAKSNQFDLQDINGVSDYYRLEEDKLYKDLSQKYNKQNYKRRDSIMRDRKADAFLSSLSSIRQNKIQQISQNRQDGFKIYMDAKTRELDEQAYEFAMHQQFGGTLTKQDPDWNSKYKEYKSKRNELIQDREEIVEEIKLEAKRQLQSGIISEAEHNDLMNKVDTNVQTTLAYRFATNHPKIFLKIDANASNKDEIFGKVHPKTYAQYYRAAMKQVIALDKQFDADKSNIDHAKFIGEYNAYWFSGNVKKLEELAVKLGNEKNWKNWDDQTARANAQTKVLAAIKSIEENAKKDKEVIGAEGLSIKMRSYEESVYDGNINTPMPDPPSAKYDFKKIFKNDEVKYASAVAEDQMLQNTLPIFRGLRMGEISQAEAMTSMLEYKPSQNSPTYVVEKNTWERVNNRLQQYDAIKNEKTVEVIRKEKGIEEDSTLSSVRGKEEAVKAFRANSFDVDSVMNHMMVYRGMKNGGAVLHDPNQQILSQLKVVSDTDAHLVRQMVKNVTMPRDILDLNKEIENKYGNWATLAKNDLLKRGIIKRWHFYSPYLGPVGFRSHLVADTEPIKVKDYISNGSQLRTKLNQIANERMLSGVETYSASEEIKEHFFRFHAYQMSRDADADPQESAEQFFQGIVLAEMPNHLPSHLQKHTWIGQQVLDDNQITVKQFEKGVASLLMKFRNEAGELDGSLFVMGADKVDPALLMKMSEEELEKYPQLTKTIKQYQKELLASSADSVTAKEVPTLSVVRNPDGETWAVALKGYPFGGILRIGESNGSGHRALTYKLDQIVSHAQSYTKRKMLYRIEGPAATRAAIPGVLPSPLDHMPDNNTANDLLNNLDQWAGRDVVRQNAVDDLREIVEERDLGELKGADAKKAIKQLSKEIREETPKTSEKWFYEDFWDFGLETFYEYIEPNWGFRE